MRTGLWRALRQGVPGGPAGAQGPVEPAVRLEK